jgi:hypothetical protein
MASTSAAVFISYARADGAVALKVATDLRAARIEVWIDQLDIAPGERWDRAVEVALEASLCVVAILSPTAVASDNVMDEVCYALDENKRVVPVIAEKCRIPLRMRRLQFIDFTGQYDESLAQLVSRLKAGSEKQSDTAIAPAAKVALRTSQPQGNRAAVTPPAAATPAPPSLLTRLSGLRKKTVIHNGHTIEIGCLGQTTIWYDGKEVSKENSLFTSRQSFRVIEDGAEAFYEVTLGQRNVILPGEWLEVKRNSEVIFTDR